MIDIHSHILPGMDDGCKTPEESCRLLQLLREQDVSLVAATSHFDANRESAAHFLERRQRAYEALRAAAPENAPEVRLGAEVSYYEGISRLQDLEDLRIQGSRLLLLEMPLDRWTEHTIGELLYLSGSGTIQILIAHIERSLGRQKPGTIDRLVDNGILLQSNANWFSRFSSRHKALRFLGDGYVHLLGSDCHNLTSRPPHLAEALVVIERKYGSEFVRQMQEYARNLVNLTP